MIKIKFFLTCVVSAFTLLACSDDSNSSGSENTPKTGARIKVFETSDIHGYIIDATGGKEETFPAERGRCHVALLLAADG